MDILKTINEIHEDALAHGFEADVDANYRLAWMLSELGEAFRAWQRDEPDVTTELIDTCIIAMDWLAVCDKEDMKLERITEPYSRYAEDFSLPKLVVRSAESLTRMAYDTTYESFDGHAARVLAGVIANIWVWIEKQGEDPEQILARKMALNRDRPYRHGLIRMRSNAES